MRVLNCIHLQHIFITFISVKTENPILNIIISCGNLKIFVVHPSQLSKIGYQLDKVKLNYSGKYLLQEYSINNTYSTFLCTASDYIQISKADTGIIQHGSHFRETVATLIKPTQLDSFPCSLLQTLHKVHLMQLQNQGNST